MIIVHNFDFYLLTFDESPELPIWLVVMAWFIFKSESCLTAFASFGLFTLLLDVGNVKTLADAAAAAAAVANFGFVNAVCWGFCGVCFCWDDVEALIVQTKKINYKICIDDWKSKNTYIHLTIKVMRIQAELLSVRLKKLQL